jgi:cyanophycinase
LQPLKAAGALNLRVLHTRDRAESESFEFNDSLTQAGGVWITGGRQWRLVDSYLNTRVHRELGNLLIRGGVIAGSSAGATIQGSFLVRGDTEGNELMMGDHLEGMAFLKNSAVDQHLLRRNRQFDLIPVIEKHPHLLGIGLDEGTAILVQRNQCRVMGKTYVAFYDHEKMKSTGAPFELLATGQKYDLVKRQRISARRR